MRVIGEGIAVLGFLFGDSFRGRDDVGVDRVDVLIRDVGHGGHLDHLGPLLAGSTGPLQKLLGLAFVDLGEFDEGGADEGLIEDVAGLAVDGEGLWFLDALRGRDEGGGEAQGCEKGKEVGHGGEVVRYR